MALKLTGEHKRRAERRYSSAFKSARLLVCPLPPDAGISRSLVSAGVLSTVSLDVCRLLFGCIFFYPFFYCIGALPLASAAPGTDISPSTAVMCVLVFFTGWAFTRGANLQKFALKQGRGTWGWGPFATELKTVPGSNNRLLCSGFWRLARHANYCGEIVQAVAWALPAWLATGSLLPWAYPAYYVALFIPRERDDERMCAARYGTAWDEYCRLVRWRIVPFLY